MSHFKSLVSTSLFMSIVFLPNLASADTTNPEQRTNQYQGWNNQGSYDQHQYAHDDQDDSEDGDNRVNGDQSPYAYQDWNQGQRAAYTSNSSNQSWKDKWDRHYGSTANNTRYYSSTPNYDNTYRYDYSHVPHYDYSGNSSYVSSPTHYDSNGYPTYQSYPADGYYYNTGYSNSYPTQYNTSGYPSYRTYPADGYYYNTNHSNNYPYSQDYHRGSGVGAGVYFNVR